jgi:hypothetical protein
MKEVFPIIPAGAGSVWFLAGIGLLLFAGAVFLGFLALSCRNASVEVSSAGLDIRGGLYGRRILMPSLALDTARPVDLKTEPELAPSWRTNGIGLPGYGAGWFTLKNGQKALAFISDRRRVAYIPTREGYVVLLSIEEPDRLIDSLRKFASARP